MMHPVVVAITGASGVVYGLRTLEILMQLKIPVHLSISESGRQVLFHEEQLEFDLDNFKLQALFPGKELNSPEVHYHHYKDFMTPIASGSHRTSAMVVCPCSGSTLAGIASASNSNLIQRAAEVHLKEKRRLVLVPRETPLSLLQIQNLEKVARAGATVLPASPGFYHGAKSISDMVDFIVARILDQLGIDNSLITRWGSDAS